MNNNNPEPAGLRTPRVCGIIIRVLYFIAQQRRRTTAVLETTQEPGGFLGLPGIRQRLHAPGEPERGDRGDDRVHGNQSEWVFFLYACSTCCFVAPESWPAHERLLKKNIPA